MTKNNFLKKIHKLCLGFSMLLLSSSLIGEIANATEAEESDIRVLQVNGRDVLIDVTFPTQTWYSIRGLTTEMPNTFTIENMEDFEVYLDGQLVENGDSIDITLEQLLSNVGIPFTFTNKATGEVKNSFIRTLHGAYDLAIGDTSDDLVDGYYYFTQGDMMYKIDTDGNVVFYLRGNIQVHDFKPWMIDGAIYYTYLEDTGDNINTGPTGNNHAVVLDSQYNVVDTIETLSSAEDNPEDTTGAQLVPNGQPLGDYDFLMLDVGHYIISSNIAEPSATIVQEIKNGELIFEWCNTDYTGCNSMDIDPSDNNLVLSFYEEDTLLKVDRKTGEIIWTLGGKNDEFNLTDEQKFSKQNFAKFSDEGILTLYDNGSANEQTRALQFILDETNKEVSDFIEYEVTHKYTASMGSAMCLNSTNDVYLMGWGSRTGDCNVFSEINFETGETLFELYDSDLEDGGSSYRVYKYAY